MLLGKQIKVKMQKGNLFRKSEHVDDNLQMKQNRSRSNKSFSKSFVNIHQNQMRKNNVENRYKMIYPSFSCILITLKDFFTLRGRTDET